MMNRQQKEERRSYVNVVFITVLILGFPFLSLTNGFLFYCLYQCVNFLAILPALTFTDCLLIVLPLTILEYVFKFLPYLNEQRSVSKLRKLIRGAFTD